MSRRTAMLTLTQSTQLHNTSHKREKNNTIVPCPVCKGRGTLIILGPIQKKAPCATCDGKGVINSNNAEYWTILYETLVIELKKCTTEQSIIIKKLKECLDKIGKFKK